MRPLVLAVLVCMCTIAHAYADTYKITAYCACKLCCGPRAKGITASGKPIRYGYVACNWLPYGTVVYIDTLGYYTVMDRGAKSLFGSKHNKIKHIDVYLPSHRAAKKFGVKYLDVTIK